MLTIAENLGSPEQVICDSRAFQGLWMNAVSQTRKWLKSNHYPPTPAPHPRESGGTEVS